MTSIPTIRLASGAAMPAVGLGLWKVANAATTDLVQQAVAAGYRHFDCACDYGNEGEVGAGLEKAIARELCRRDELWITSKLWNTFHRPDHVRIGVERTLRDLRLDYLDLYLVHFPIALEYVPPDRRYPPGWFFDPSDAAPRMRIAAVPLAETWGAMEELVGAGLAKHIGVCNFNCSLLRDLLSYARIPPEVLQVELHPYLAQEKLLRFCRESADCRDRLLTAGGVVLPRPEHGNRRGVGSAPGRGNGRGSTTWEIAGPGRLALGRPTRHGGRGEDLASRAIGRKPGHLRFRAVTRRNASDLVSGSRPSIQRPRRIL